MGAMTTHVLQISCLKDNYTALVHDSGSGRTFVLDAPDSAPILAAAAAQGWALTDVLLTHHHADHVQGVPALRAAYPGLRVVGPGEVKGVDLVVKEGDFVGIGAIRARVIETPGHTAGHIVYVLDEEEMLFAGDTLFSLGCGRVFETPLDVMWASLMKLAALPGETQVYCGHEYTQSNAHFALSIEPDNADLVERAAHVATLRAQDKPTVPTTIALELATNPFLRAEIPAVQAAVGLAGADPAQVFGELRRRKDVF